MGDNFIHYEFNGKRYKIPTDKKQDFESKAPDAKMMLTFNGKSYGIPLSEVDNFIGKAGVDNVTYSEYDDNKEYSPKLSTRKYMSFEAPDNEVGSNESVATPVVDKTPSYIDAIKDPNLSGKEKRKIIREAKRSGEMPNTFETIGKSIGTIGTSIGGMVVDAANLGMKMSRLQNPAIGLPDIVELKTGKPIPEELRSQAQVDLDKASEKLQGATEKLSMGADPTNGQMDFVELVKAGRFGLAMQKGLGSTIESAPMMVASRNPYTAAIYMVGMAASNYADETRENPDIPMWKRAANAAGSAALEMAIEKVADPLKSLLGNGASALTEEAAKEIIEKATKEGVQTISKRILRALGNTIKDSAGEGLEEVGTSLGNDALGSALDAIDKDRDYGFKAQWEEYKAQNPNATKGDFANAKAKEYLNSFLGGALSGVYMSGFANAVKETQDARARKQFDDAYTKGTTGDYRNLYDVDDAVKKDIEKATKAFTSEDGTQSLSKEYIAGLSAEAAFALSRNMDLPAKQRLALGNLAIRKAQQEGLNNGLNERVDSEVNANRAIINGVAENGDVVIGRYNGNTVYVKGGVTKNGTVTLPSGEAGPVVVINTQTGEKQSVNSKDIVGALTRNAEELANEAEQIIRGGEQRARELARNTMSPLAKLNSVRPYAGKKILVNLGNGVTEVYVQQVSPKGEVLIKGKKGDLGGQSFLTLNSSTFYDSIHRDAEGNPTITDVGKEEQEQYDAIDTTEPIQTPEADVDGTEDFKEKGTHTILIAGKPVEVEVTYQDNASDTVNYEYIDESGNRKVGSTTVGGFKAAIQQAEQYKPTESPAPENENPTPVEPISTDVPAETTQAPTEVPVTPETIDWDALLDNEPDSYFAEMQKRHGDKIEKRLNAVIAAMQNQLAALDKAKPQNQDEIFENEEKKELLQSRIDKLNEMVGRLSAATEVAPETESESPSVPETEVPTTQVGEAPAAPEATAPEVPTTPEPEVTPEPQPEPAPAPVAPTIVDNPSNVAQEEEKKLQALLRRNDLNRNEKRDWAYKYGKKVADMFATQEEYEEYEDYLGADLGSYYPDFKRGVEESFANRPKNSGNSQENGVSLGTEPSGGNNGTEAGTETPEGTEGYNGTTGGQHTYDEGGEEGTQEAEGLRGGDTNQEIKYPARNGDATRQLLMDTFGFVSVSPGISQENLNHIYDFLMEMSKMLGISPTSISHGATLGMGVLGGRSSSTLARYEYRATWDGTIKEPYIRFKNSLLSSIAHEWWHSLDQVLSYYETGRGKKPATTVSANEFTGRPEVLDAIREVLKAINKSGHKERLEIEYKNDPDYLAYSKRKKELAARFFEGYIKTKFAEAGIVVNGFAQNQTNTPTAEELKPVIPAFDNLFNVLKEKEGKKDGSTVLYHIGHEVDEAIESEQFTDDAIDLTNAVIDMSLEGVVDVERASDEQTQEVLALGGIDNQFSVETDKPIFISNAALAVQGIKMEKATPEQWLKMIKNAGGIKAGEDKWMGLSDWLKAQDKKTLTKQEVLDYITANTIQTEEVHYAEVDYFKEDAKLISAINDEFLQLKQEAESSGELPYDAGDIAYQMMVDKYGDDFSIGFGVDLGELYVSNRKAASVVTGVDLGVERVIDETRLGYTTEGLKNYKEIAITVPTIESWNESDEIHFGDAGNGRAVAWVRFGEVEVPVQDASYKRLQEIYDRLAQLDWKIYNEGLSMDEYEERSRLREERDSLQELEGKTQRVLVIDEIQSKRHQEGRERGYKVSREKADAEMDKFMKRMHDKYDFSSSTPFAEVFNEEEMREHARLSMQQHRATFGTTTVPDAPFDKNWHELAMKRMLRYAAENGYDAIAWTKGEQQAERYSLAKSFSGIEREDRPDGEGGRRFTLYGGNMDTIYADESGVITSSSISDELKGKHLSDVVGKDMANKMMSLENNDIIDGEDLTIGGEGMKGFYDKMLPAFMDKYGKKWGVKTADIELPNVEKAGRYMHSVPVTEAMRASVMEGQPMFFKTPNGIVYGWTDGKKIYLTKAGMNPNTKIHEYTHLWAKAMMQKNPKGWNSIKQLLKNTPVWNEVMNDANYSDIHGNEDMVASEVISRISGTKNAAKLEQMAQQMIDEAKGTMRKAEARGLIQNIKDALNKFWSWVGKNLFEIENFDSIDEITDRVLYDLVNKTDLGELSEGQVETQIVTDPEVIAELEASPKVAGFRNVVQNEDGTFSSPMAYWLQSTKEGAKSRVETAKFELGKWEEAEEHPELVDDNGKVTLVKPNKSTVDGVAYDPYIHNRLEPVNLQFKDAWKRDDLVYVETEVAENDLNDGYHADKALLPVGVHSWSNGDVMLSRYDKPVRIMPWEEVADAWAKRLNGEGVHFDVVPPAMRSLLVERGVEILPPHKGMGKKCNDAYKAWKEEADSDGLIFRSSDSPITPEMDSAYLKAVEAGDMETAQRMVIEAARLAMPNTKVIDEDGNPKVVYHGTGSEFYTFRDTSDSNELGAGYYFSDSYEMAERYATDESLADNRFRTEALAFEIFTDEMGHSDEDYDDNEFIDDYNKSYDLAVERLFGNGHVKSVFLNLENPRILSRVSPDFDPTYRYGFNHYNEGVMAKRFNDGVIDEMFTERHEGLTGNQYVAFSPSQIKSADPVTYDDKGHVIPLSQRFNPENPDIRYRKSDAQNVAVDYLAGDARLKAIENAVNEEAKKLGVKVTYKTREEMPAGHKNDKGYYNPQTGEIVVCTENATSIADAIKTILHEAVAHKGLRKLFGNRFDEFIRNVYDLLDAETKAKVDARAAAHYNGDTAVAMEEYMASLAENENFSDQTIWEKIKSIFTNLINDILGRNDIKIGDNELRYILRASYNNMVNPRSMETIEGWAKDQLMREEYKVNESTPEILSRTGIDPTEVASETARQVYDKTVNETWQEFQRQFQDAYQPVRIAIDAIQQETGNVPIEDYENFLLIQNQMSSRSRVEIDKFQRRYYSPIISQVNAIIDTLLAARGFNIKDKAKRAEVYKEVINYLIAKHGIERNKYYQSTKTRKMTAKEMKPELDAAQADYQQKVDMINMNNNLSDSERELQLRDALDEYNAVVQEIKSREVPDMRDYSGLTSLFGLDSKEYEEAERMAQEMVDNFEKSLGRVDNEDGEIVEQSEAIDKMWEKINKATDKTLRHSYESGLLSRQQYNDIKAMFKFYIPLRGFDETTAEDIYSYARFEGNRFNPAVQTAKGRTSVADDPIAIIMNMAESEIAQGNKNRAKQALYNYLLNRTIMGEDGKEQQNSLMQVEDVWYVKGVDSEGNEIYQIATPDRSRGESWEEFEVRMQTMAEEGNAYKSKKGKLDVGMRFQKQRNQGAHYVYLKVNGVEKAIYINGDPKAADAINGTYRPETNAGVEKMRELNRLVSSTFTNYSLEFTARNYFRDMIYSHINIGIKESDPAYRKKFRQNWRHNNLRTVKNMLKAYKNGEYEGRPLTEDEAAFVEFMENGGQTGYTLINSVESRKRDLERAIRNMQNGSEGGGVKDTKAFKATLGAIELLNESSELVTRFAAFKTSRDMGRSINKSISDAKEITVNFNTKGAQDGKGLAGFIARYFGWSKYFFNASVQGVQNIKAMAEANKLKFCSAVGGIAGLGFCMPIIAGALSELFGGDDDDENAYWNIPEYDRQNNLCIPVGNTYLKIPLPIGFREVYAIGDMVAAMAFDKKFTRDVSQVGMDIANKIASTVLPINPLESSANGLNFWHTFLYTALPSSAQFAIQNATNLDWKGVPLQKEYTYNEDDPQWMKAYASNPDWMVTVAKWCNENTQFGDYEGWDWSPEKLDNTLSNMFGGIYTIVKKTGKTISMAWNEESRTTSNIPLAGVVLGSGIGSDDMYMTDSYYDMLEYYDSNVNLIKRRAKQFGFDLDDVFVRKKGAHQPKMQEIYSNPTFEWMQEWYKGNKELEKYDDNVKKLEQKIAESDNPSETNLRRLNRARLQFEQERREFINDMLELD